MTHSKPFYSILLFVFLLVTSAVAQAEKDPPFSLPPIEDVKKIRSAIIFTEKGPLYIRLFPAAAPWHVANFKFLADRGFYKNMRFHLFKPGYVIQAGAPGKKANSGPGYTIPPEFNEHSHSAGALSMVRRPNDLDIKHTRRSHGSQFRILLKDASNMDGQFTVFGKIIKGLAIAKQLEKGDLIKNITVFVKKDITDDSEKETPSSP